MKIYYHNDLDGRCAGAIVYKHFIEGLFDKDGIQLIELDYKDVIDLHAIKRDELVVIADFSFKPKVMEEVLKKTTHIYWLDHHKTAFEYKYSRDLYGLRDIAFSGCELAWRFYFPKLSMPRAVELIGDRDKWAWKFGEETANFNQGIKLADTHPTGKIWEDLLNDGFLAKSVVSKTIEDGRICVQFRDSFCKDYVDSFGFETKLDGHRAFAIGLYMFGSEAFGEKIKEYPLCIAFEWDGNKWTVGLYSEQIDVSEIAKKYGGGGHKGAAGFTISKGELFPLERGGNEPL